MDRLPTFEEFDGGDMGTMGGFGPETYATLDNTTGMGDVDSREIGFPYGWTIPMYRKKRKPRRKKKK